MKLVTNISVEVFKLEESSSKSWENMLIAENYSFEGETQRHDREMSDEIFSCERYAQLPCHQSP